MNVFLSCEVADWGTHGMDPNQFPDNLKYLRLLGTGMQTLDGEGFEGKHILALEVTGHSFLTMTKDSFIHMEDLQQLFIHQVPTTCLCFLPFHFQETNVFAEHIKRDGIQQCGIL